jgi:hypothetical protein
MRRLTTGIRSQKCVVRRFRHYTNVQECTYTNLLHTYLYKPATHLLIQTYYTPTYTNLLHTYLYKPTTHLLIQTYYTPTYTNLLHTYLYKPATHLVYVYIAYCS